MDTPDVGTPPVRATRLITVGSASLEDAQACLDLYRRVLDEGKWFVTDIEEFAGTLAWQRRIIQDFNRQRNSAFLVARRAGEVIGVLTLQGGRLRRMVHVAKMEIYVDAAARGMGVGRLLMDAGLTWAESHAQLRKVGLAVFEDNVRAIAFYRSLGFKIEGRRAGEYREPDGRFRADVLMSRVV